MCRKNQDILQEHKHAAHQKRNAGEKKQILSHHKFDVTKKYECSNATRMFPTCPNSSHWHFVAELILQHLLIAIAVCCLSCLADFSDKHLGNQSFIILIITTL